MLEYYLVVCDHGNSQSQQEDDQYECSQQTTTTESQKSSTRSFGGDDRILSPTTTDLLCSPLATICQELFDGYDAEQASSRKCHDRNNATSTTKPQGMAKESQGKESGSKTTKTRKTISENHDDQNATESQSSTNLLGSPNAGANTQHAASVMLSLIHTERRDNTKKVNDEIAASGKENGNNNGVTSSDDRITGGDDDSSSTTLNCYRCKEQQVWRI